MTPIRLSCEVSRCRPPASQGYPVTFSVNPFDVWPIASINFAFGDDTSMAGTSVSHTCSAAGTYEVTVTASDAAGNHGTTAGSDKDRSLP